MKIGLFLKRERGMAATPPEWDTRSLPAPHARLAFAVIEKCDRFSSRWGRWSKRLCIGDFYCDHWDDYWGFVLN